MSKRIVSITLVLVALIMAVAAVSAHAVSKKTVYVCTKMSAKQYEDDRDTDAKAS